MELQRAVTLFLGEQIASTRRSYFYVLKAMQNYIGLTRDIQGINPDDLIEHMQKIRARPEITSPATVNKHVKTIRTFFNWCIKTNLMKPPSPADALKRQRQSRFVDRDKAMPDYLYEQLLDYARWTPRYHALVLFLGDTGCRIGGAAGLKWTDIDFETRTATVTEKGEKSRKVFFGLETANALYRWRQQVTFKRGDHVFQKDGSRMKNDSLGQLFEKCCQRAGIGQWGPHSLRHRKGHQFADNKIAPTIAAMALGHENPTTTLESYYPQDWDRVKKEMEKLAHKSDKKSSKIIDFEEKFKDS